MLRHRCRIILAQLLSPRTASPVSQLRRLVSAAAPVASLSPLGFAVEDYLVATCGLTRAQARKASAKLSHLRAPSNPDAVLAFLAGLGLSGADAAALVAKDPVFLCARVDKTLAPVVAGLTGAGLSRSEIARLVTITSIQFRCRSVVSGVEYYLRLFGSSEDLFRALRRGSCLLSADLERVVKPNAAFLQECGLGACDIARLCNAVPWMLSANPERVRAMAACAEGVGVPRGSKMFRHALQAVAFLSEEKLAAKVEYLKKTFGWSDAEVGIAASKAPFVLRKSMESLQRRSEFLISEVGLAPAYIAPRSIILNYSLEGWLRPRYYVVKFLKANGLLEFSPSYFTTVRMSKNVFEERFICPYKEAAPHLAQDYEAACTGALPTNFKFS